MRRITISVALLAATALLSAGCGFFDDDSANDAGSTPATVGSPDDQVADASLLTLDDFEEGWTDVDVAGDVSAAIVEQVPACEGSVLDREGQSGRAETRSFEDGNRNRYDVTVTVYEDRAEAEAAIGEVDPTPCLQGIVDEFSTELDLATGTQIDVTWNPDSGLGDHSTTALALLADGRTLEFTTIQQGRSVASVYATSANLEDLDVTTTNTLVAERMQSAQDEAG